MTHLNDDSVDVVDIPAKLAARGRLLSSSHGQEKSGRRFEFRLAEPVSIVAEIGGEGLLSTAKASMLPVARCTALH